MTGMGVGRWFPLAGWAIMAAMASGGSTGAAAADRTVAIEVVNLSEFPVHAVSVALAPQDLRRRLGLFGDAPLRVRGRDSNQPVPWSRGVSGTGEVLRLFVSLAPESRLDLVAEPAERWPDEFAPAAGGSVANLPRGTAALAAGGPLAAAGELNNEVLQMTLEPSGWKLSYASSAGGVAKTSLVTGGKLEFWVDDRNRGRIANGNPKDMGLLAFPSDATLESCVASVGPGGRPQLRKVSRFGGFAKDLSVIETFELVPGLPLMLCRVQWRNDGDAPLWIAYVGSGDGIKGRWSKDLMPTPLIERKKSAVQGDIDGSETRPAWIGQLCRISMESPATGCGVGLSTLLPTPGRVGQGSMIWGCSGSGFQCNFIDPVQGQFPFLVQPRSTLDNGFAFLASQAGASVFRQTVELWLALQKEKMPDLAPPCAVFVDGEPVAAQTVNNLPDKSALWQASGDTRRVALRLDFNRYYQCRVSVSAASEQEPVEILAKPFASSKPAISLLRAVKAGDYSIELNTAFAKPDETAFVLETRSAVAASLKGLSIVETLPVAPRPLSPVPDADLTDLAVMFRWAAIPMVVDYDLQWGRKEDFSDAVSVKVTTSGDYPHFLPADDQLPAPGRWFWRVRGIKGALAGDWSPTRVFTVNDDHSKKPVKRPLTPERPLFTLEATRTLDYTAFQPDIPADIAPYVGVIAEGFEAKGIPVTDFARGMEKLPHAILLRSHWVGLGDIEWLFQHVPNFAGIQGGEHLSDLYKESPRGEMRYAHRLLRLCAKYGMFFQEADGTYRDDKWQELMDRQGPFIREFGPWLVLSQKNNIIRRQFYSQSAALGLWLGGVTHQHGAWEDGGFYWQNAGFNGLGRCDGERRGALDTMPRIFWNLVCVMGIARGCGIYSLDGQTLMYSEKAVARDPRGPWPSAIWNESGKTTDTFRRFVAPLIRATVQHRLIPSKQDVLANVRLAVFNDRTTVADEKTWTHYVEYGPLFAGTYGFRKMGGIDGQLWEFFPNTGRYYFIPVLPQGDAPLGPSVRNVPVSQLQDIAAVKRLFDAAYPPRYDGDAFVCRAGDTVTILNSRENEDVTETFAIPLKGGPVSTIAGRIAPHSFVVGKIGAGGRTLWMQANTEYPERDTELSIACDRKPEWTIAPPAAATEAKWDDALRTLTLRLSHRDGAVEATLK